MGQHSPETKESTGRTLEAQVLSEGALHAEIGSAQWQSGAKVAETHGVLPVLETDLLAIRSTSSSQNDSEDDQSDDGEDLDTGEPEFALSVDPGTGEVDSQNDYQADGDPDGVVDLFVPVVDEDRGGGQFCFRECPLKSVRAHVLSASKSAYRQAE